MRDEANRSITMEIAAHQADHSRVVKLQWAIKLTKTSYGIWAGICLISFGYEIS